MWGSATCFEVFLESPMPQPYKESRNIVLILVDLQATFHEEHGYLCKRLGLSVFQSQHSLGGSHGQNEPLQRNPHHHHLNPKP